jgi:hypothetical protein
MKTTITEEENMTMMTMTATITEEENMTMMTMTATITEEEEEAEEDSLATYSTLINSPN